MPGHAGGRFDLWNQSATIASAQARDLAAVLELRAQDVEQIAARAAYMDLIGVAAGVRVLDVGCGSGAVTRDLARRAGHSGAVVGLDPGAAFLDIARDLASREELAKTTEFCIGDARVLPFADGAFDVALAATTLAHTPDAERAIPELVRVVRPGGRVGIFDLDGDGFIVAHPDQALTRRIAAASSELLIVDGWLVRRLPALLAAAGLHSIGVRAFTPIERNPDGFYAWLTERRADAAVRAEAVSADEHRQWLDALHGEQAAGRFLAGQTHLFVWGTSPAE